MVDALSRRAFAAGLSASAALITSQAARAQAKGRVVVVGGGYGGATAARFLKRYAPALTVVLVEPNDAYVSCPFSNLVLAGERDLDAQTFSYDALAADGIERIQDRAETVDPDARRLVLSGGQAVLYDRLILSPGIDIRWNALEGYSLEAADTMPHAWKAGPQTLLLRRQLEAMDDGGLVVISAPAAPYRCPPGPYERASLIAHYLKTQKPRSKLLILDAKDNFSKRPLFLNAWAELYGDMLEWRGASDDGRVSRVDARANALETDFERFEADVANVIPPQQAGFIAQQAAVADATGWCPVDAVSFESTLQPNIHVIGDASIAAPMPKSAFAANAQGKICALQIARLMSDLPPEPTVLANTCYSYIAPDQAISVAGVYRNDGGAFKELAEAGGVSLLDPPLGDRAREALQASDWFKAVTSEAFG